jgi:hypothetical protein
MNSIEISFLAAACVPPVDWRDLVDRTDAQGTLPLLSRALYRTGALAVPPEFLADIDERVARKTLRSLLMAGELAHLMRSFEDAGLTPIAFKGPILSYLAFGDLALRDSTDLDIYVPRPQLQTALDLLQSDGYRLKSAGFRTSLAGACEVALQRPESGSEVDLHWEFSPPYFLKFDAARALRRSVIVQISGLAARTLCNEDLLIYLCIHAARECWGMRQICDLAALLPSQTFDWDDIFAEISRAHCWRAVAVGLKLATSVLDTPLPTEIRQRVDRDRTVCAIAAQFARNLAGDSPDHGGTPGGAMLHLRMMDTAGSRISYLSRRALQPNHLDADFIQLPHSMEPAYYLIRPLRVACAALGLLRLR